jgi:putative endonuclease
MYTHEEILKWYVYIVECNDSSRSLYTGITNNVEKRIDTHNKKKGAKYTKTRTPVKLVYQQSFETKSLAAKEEWRIKQLTRNQKILLINQN